MKMAEWVRCRLRFLLPAIVCAFFTFPLCAPAAESAPLASETATPASEHWVGSWATAVMDMGCCSLAPTGYRRATLRQIVHLSLGGTSIRLHLSNAFGTRPLVISAVHVARAVRPGSSQIESASDTPVTFDGKVAVTIPAHTQYLSDPVAIDLPAHSDLAVTIFYDQMPAVESGHPGARATSFVLGGKHLSDAALSAAWQIPHFYTLSAVDVRAPKADFAVVALGDSITDGHGATTDKNARWPDALAGRLKNIGVLNLGIGGGRVLNPGIGPSALARFNRDVLAQSGVKTVILMEGVNDIGVYARTLKVTDADYQAFADRVIGGYRQIIARAHAAGLKILGATLTPWLGSDYYHPGAAGEAVRQKLNRWIRAPGHFDGMIDFDARLRDPKRPAHYRPVYDLGDHLHPSDAGYAAMGALVAADQLQ